MMSIKNDFVYLGEVLKLKGKQYLTAEDATRLLEAKKKAEALQIKPYNLN